MYHCQIQFYFLHCEKALCETIRGISPLQDFTHEFLESSEAVEEWLAKADVIFFGGEKVGGQLLQLVKPGAECILLADKEQIAAMTEQELAAYTDIWTLPLAQKELTFHFKRWQQLYKTSWDRWEMQNFLDATINSVPHLIWYKDKEGAHHKVNQSFCKAVNKSMEQIEGRGHYYIWDIDPDEYAKGEFICMESEYEVMDKRETCIFDEKVLIGDDMRELKTYKSPLFDIDGSVMGTVGIATDVTQEHLYEQMIINNANTDFLTGLYNRRYLYQFMEEEGENPFVIYYLDLDNFKGVNDKYGHHEGDRALILTKETLRRCMPECMIARIGGDEFLVVQMGDYARQEIEEKRHWLEEQLDQAFADEEHFCGISASIGAAASKGGNADANGMKVGLDAMIGEADAFMYREKNRKKNR